MGQRRAGHPDEKGPIAKRVRPGILSQEGSAHVLVDREHLLLTSTLVTSDARDHRGYQCRGWLGLAFAASWSRSSFHAATVHSWIDNWQASPAGAIVAAMSRAIVATEQAPKAIGPYSQAIVASGGRMVFCSGQIPIDPSTGALAGAGDIRQETERVMKNLDAVLRAAGAGLRDVVKTTIYLVDLANFATVNEIYGSYFPSEPPARVTVQVAALPKGAQVEIDAIAVLA
jgi:2-iminobutanoate/2-iminopropanoate deaminase